MDFWIVSCELSLHISVVIATDAESEELLDSHLAWFHHNLQSLQHVLLVKEQIDREKLNLCDNKLTEGKYIVEY